MPQRDENGMTTSGTRTNDVARHTTCSVRIVTFESTSRTTAAGNHVEAVRSGLALAATVTVVGSDHSSSATRWMRTLLGWFRDTRARDLVYVRNHPLSGLIVVLARARRQRVVLEVNGPPEDLLGAHPRFRAVVPALRLALRLSAHLADRLVVPTPGMKDYLQAMARAKPIAVIPAGFDESVFYADDDQPVEDAVVFVGANTRWQGVDVLHAATTDDAWPRSVRLVIVGPFSEEAARTDPGSATISVTGVLPPAEVARLLRGALAAVSPKTYQVESGPSTGQAPLKVYEALGCGVPCIVSDVPLQNALIQEYDCGQVVPVGDPAALARAVARYAADRSLRDLHAANSRIAAARFSWHELARQTRAFVLSSP